MIPKTIHYCWFGGTKKTEKVQLCLNSWHRFLPEYKIIEWNESNFDVSEIPFTEEAYSAKKWAFVSDYARLKALYQFGGIYFDTDIEVLKPFDELLENEAFLGFESNDFIMTAVIGARSGNLVLKEIMDSYKGKSFLMKDGSYNSLPNPYVFTSIMKKRGLISNGKEQIVNGIRVYPQICFSPNNFSMIWNRPHKKSYTIHHYEQSWREDDRRKLDTLPQRIRKYGVGVGRNIVGTKELVSIRNWMKK